MLRDLAKGGGWDEFVALVPSDGPVEWDTFCFSANLGRRFRELLTRASLNVLEASAAVNSRSVELLAAFANTRTSKTQRIDLSCKTNRNIEVLPPD